MLLFLSLISSSQAGNGLYCLHSSSTLLYPVVKIVRFIRLCEDRLRNRISLFSECTNMRKEDSAFICLTYTFFRKCSFFNHSCSRLFPIVIQCSLDSDFNCFGLLVPFEERELIEQPSFHISFCIFSRLIQETHFYFHYNQLYMTTKVLN